jgi:o-succinylbenzoate---CoA ligase
LQYEILPDWLTRRASTDGDVIAIQNGRDYLTYRQLYDEAGKLAGALSRAGVDRGQRVAVLARHGLSFAVAMHALMQLDAILVPINCRLTGPEISWQLSNTGARILLHDEQYKELAGKVTRELESNLILLNLQAKLTDGPHLHRTHIDLSNTHVIMHTSGTTGHPKGVMLTYRNHIWMAMASAC